MGSYTYDELRAILGRHAAWLRGEPGGSHADLRDAVLSGASLFGASLVAPTVLLLAWWGPVSDELCADLMVWDAANHPDPSAFDDWASGSGGCPYDGVSVQRAAYFEEQRDLWDPDRPVRRPYDLMVDLIREKCAPGSADHLISSTDSSE